MFTHNSNCNNFMLMVIADGEVYTESGIQVSQEHVLIFFTGADREY